MVKTPGIIITLAIITGITLLAYNPVIKPRVNRLTGGVEAPPGVNRAKQVEACTVHTKATAHFSVGGGIYMKNAETTRTTKSGYKVPRGMLTKYLSIETNRPIQRGITGGESEINTDTIKLIIKDPKGNKITEKIGKVQFPTSAAGLWVEGDGTTTFKTHGLASGISYTFEYHGTTNKGNPYADSPITTEVKPTC